MYDRIREQEYLPTDAENCFQQNFTNSRFLFFLSNHVETSWRAQTKNNPRGRGEKVRRMKVQADKNNRKF